MTAFIIGVFVITTVTLIGIGYPSERARVGVPQRVLSACVLILGLFLALMTGSGALHAVGGILLFLGLMIGLVVTASR